MPLILLFICHSLSALTPSSLFLSPAGYGWCHMPTTPGEHAREIPVFRPGGSTYDDIAALFVGGHPRYQDPSVILTPDSRAGHGVHSVGIVTLNVNVVLRGFGGNVVFA
jgi:B9 domain-containing protein 2